jgi:phosphoglycolate phosphatase-like HAD superfamily hydrolase
MPELTYLLFDVDGVIVDPQGYIAGVTKTLQLLCHKTGLTNTAELLPTKAEIARMEAAGVHDVWDITNIIFCQILTSIAGSGSPSHISIGAGDTDVDSKLALIAATGPQVPKPEFEEMAKAIAAQGATAHPPDVALSVLSQKLKHRLADNLLTGWVALLGNFLNGTRNPYQSYGTKLFQNIILGSEEFARTYELESKYDGESLLLAKDKVLITEQSVSRVMALTKSPHWRVGIYTARPSHPPADAPGSKKGYSPEAELALECAGMSSLPLVGMGMMEWLAVQTGHRSEELTKPNTTQAIAALLASTTGTTSMASLNQAYRLDKLQEDPDNTPLLELKGCSPTIFVFEDTISGITPMLSVGKRLNQMGYSIKVEPLGIASDSKKKSALQKLCPRVFNNINDALDHALGTTV